MNRLQRNRLWTRSAFFALFALAPPLDLFRLDLTLGHFILFGFDWTLGIDAFLAGKESAGVAALHLLVRGLIPIIVVIGGVIWVAWHYGRLYCGWLCPHFSVVELINALMRRAIGRHSLWDRHRLPEQLPDGRRIVPRPIYWLAVLLAVGGFAFLWAVVLLTYLLPPKEVYGNLIALELTRNQALFIGVGTLLFCIEFLLARHLFCRFACAVGLFQSLAWMGNKRAMVVGFQRERVTECAACNNACDNACPMRLKPRAIKRRMFTCTQCARCIQACQTFKGDPKQSLLSWVSGAAALDVSDREFGRSGNGPAPATHPAPMSTASTSRPRCANPRLCAECSSG